MRPDLGRWARRLGLCAILAGALAYVPYRVYGSNGYVHYRALEHQERTLAAGNEALRLENGRLRREIVRLRDDLGAVEATARDDLGMVAPGEIVVQIEGDPAAGQASAPGPGPVAPPRAGEGAAP